MFMKKIKKSIGRLLNGIVIGMTSQNLIDDGFSWVVLSILIIALALTLFMIIDEVKRS